MFVYHECFISAEFTFLKELMLIKQVHRKNVTFVSVTISQILALSFNQMCGIDVMIY